MAEVKDKVVTAESLKALHDYNQTVYMPMILKEGTEHQYGDELPPAGIKGRIFFKRLTE